MTGHFLAALRSVTAGAGSTSYTYDGAGRRVRQTVGANTTNYLLDVSMGLWETLTATTGANVTRYVHSPAGLLSQHDGTSWDWTLADGLGSVRSVVDGSANVLWSSHYAPYGSPFGGTGTSQTVYGYTGEPTDGNGLVYLRNRYYAPGIGIFASLDPLETANRYAYVGGNVVNMVDPSGLLWSSGGGACPRGQRRNSAGRCVSMGRDEYLPPSEQTRTVTRGQGGTVTQRVTSLDPARNGALLQERTWGRTVSATSTRGDEYLLPSEQTRTVTRGQGGTVTQRTTSLDPAQNGAVLNERTWDRTSLLMQATEEQYGIVFANHEPDRYGETLPAPEWNWDNVAAVTRGLRQIESALRQTQPFRDTSQARNGNEVQQAMRSRFEGVEFFVGAGRNLTAAAALINGIAVVPPVGLGGTGRQVYFETGSSIHYTTVIHEMGHIVDFDLGSNFAGLAGINLDSPSTRFAAQTGGSYDAPPFLCSNALWGVCVGIRGGSGYVPGGNPPQYSGGTPPDQFEDFAESWSQWVLGKNRDPFFRGLDGSRSSFFERDAPLFFQ